MKKIGLLVSLFVCAMMAYAGDYAYLVFTNTAGTTTAMDVSSLTMTVSGSNLQVTNSAGTVNFTLTDLAAMQFSKDTVLAIDNVIEGDKTVSVFSISGVTMGSFPSIRDAAESLNNGAYVVTQGGKSTTIVVQ